MRRWSLLRFWSWLLSQVGHARGSSGDLQNHGTTSLLQQKEDECTGEAETVKERFGKRHELILLLFLGFAGVYAMRVNLSVAIVAMVIPHPSTLIEKRQLNDTCPLPMNQQRKAVLSDSVIQSILILSDCLVQHCTDHSPQRYWKTKRRRTKSRICLEIQKAQQLFMCYAIGEFNWDERTQGMLLGSFFYGYFLTNYLGGRLADRLGGRLIYGVGIVLTALLTLISPLAARHSIFAFVFVRILEGMTEGVTFPAMNVMASHWIPPQERARSLARIVGGCQFGTVVTLSISGWLTQTSWGWPSIFYIFGLYGLLWGWFWFRYAYDTPDIHPNISVAEKLYIKQGIGEHRRSECLDVPWRSILTSTPFLVVIVAHIGHNWGFYCLLTELPTYLKNIQHYDMKQNGILSAMPYLVMWLFSLMYSSIMDHFLEKKVFSTKQIRQFSMVVANYIPMLSVLLIPWARCDGQLAVVLICIAVGATGASWCGMHCAFQELAPNFSGTLTGISNTFATIPGFLAPAVTGAIINNQQTLSRWKEVFQLVSLVYLVVCSLYLIFMSSEIQPWNEGNAGKRKRPLKEVSQLKAV